MKAGTSRFVLDASMAVAWCFEDESTPFTERVLDALTSGAEAISPSIWPFEVANALLLAERRNRISVAQVTALLRRIRQLPIAIEPINTDGAFDRIMNAARQQQLTAYDASYLELALRESLPLATLDDKLMRAARSAGVRLLRP